MPSVDLLLEGERRGLLSDDQQNLLNEARRRGMAPGAPSDQDQAQAPSWSLTDLPGNLLTGAANILPAAYNLVTQPFDILSRVRAPISPERTAELAKQRKEQGFFSPLASDIKGVGKEFALGTASGATFGVPDALKLIPPPANQEAADFRTLGQYAGGALTGKKLFDVAKLAMSPFKAALAAPAVMSAAPSVAQGDIGGTIENAITGAGLGAAGLGLGRAGGELLNRFSPEQRALRAESNAIGGGRGVVQQVGREATQGRMPGTATEIPASVEEAGQTVQNAGLLAGQKAREAATQFRNQAISLAPPDAQVPHSSIEKLRSLVDEGSTTLQSSTSKKLGQLANELDQKVTGPAIGFGKRGLAGAPQDVIDQVRATLGLQGEGVTFKDLVGIREELNKIPTPNDQAARLVKMARKAVDSDIDTFGQQYPDAVKAYRQWQQFYGREVGQYHGEGAPLRSLTEQEYGRFTTPASQVIPKLASQSPEYIRNVYEGIRKGPNGEAAVDNIQAGAAQHLIESSLDPVTQQMNPRSLIKTLRDPASARKWQELLGPRYENFRKLSDALAESGIKPSDQPAALGFWEGFHILRGGMMAAAGNPIGAAYHLMTGGTMALAPAWFDNMVNSALGRQLLAKGLVERAGTPAAAVVQAKIADFARKQGMPTDIDVTPPERLPSQSGGTRRGLPPTSIEMGVRPPGFQPPRPPPLTLREPAINLGQRPPPGQLGLPQPMIRQGPPPNAPIAMGSRITDVPATVQTPATNEVLRGYQLPKYNIPTTPIRMGGSKINELSDFSPMMTLKGAQSVVDALRARFADGGMANADELAVLQEIAQNPATPERLSQIANRLYSAFQERQQHPAINRLARARTNG